jgi:hypothetical protein
MLRVAVDLQVDRLGHLMRTLNPHFTCFGTKLPAPPQSSSGQEAFRKQGGL